MSDHDFDNYLTLLSSLLRFDAKQRASIADELRSHLEERLEDLVARGVARDEAIKQALAEFGDAAGLAGQFVTLSRNRKRRWLMRLTTFSIAAALLLAAGLTLLWPARNAAPGPAAVVAQAPPAADPFAAPPAPAAKAQPLLTKTKDKPSAASVIAEKLEQTSQIDVVEMPLKDVVNFIAEQHHIPIVLVAKKLEEASVSPDTPVTKTLQGIRLKSALNLILRDLELTYIVRDEVLQITTPEDAQSDMEIRVYDCRDILTMAGPGRDKKAPASEGGVGAAAPPAQPGMPGGFGVGGGFGTVNEHNELAQRLMMIITTNVDPQTWQGAANPGAGISGGTVSEYSGLIVVTQTAQTHKKIEHVLDMLREAAGLDVPQTGKVVR